MASTSSSPKRPSSALDGAPPLKRHCTLDSAVLDDSAKRLPNIATILHTPVDVVWSLRKHDMRKYFFALQAYALKALPDIPDPAISFANANSRDGSSELPPFLRLPLEIRHLIYSHLVTLEPEPRAGPHPRQLQTHILLSQSFSPQVLVLNRQIYDETLPLFYGSPAQTVYITINYNIWSHKTQRSNLVISNAVTSCIRNVDLTIHLGSEKKKQPVEAHARLVEVAKGIKKLRKWLASANLQTLRISWQEPPQTYTWEQKRDVLDGLKPLRAHKVEVGEINWGLKWNKSKKYEFESEYLVQLERSNIHIV